MKNLKLIPGYLVDGYSGKIEEVRYCKIDCKDEFSSVIVTQAFIFSRPNEKIFDMITEHNEDKIFDNHGDALIRKDQVQKGTLSYLAEQVAIYQDRLKTYMLENGIG